MNYVPLHVHTHFSLLDGTSTPKEYVERAVALGMTACAITDHGTLAGHREFVRECNKVGIKPILGCEVYICDDISQENQYNHMVLLAKNDEGLQNLHKLQEIAWTDGFKQKPRIDYSLLEQYSNGLVATSGCLSGPLAKAIEQQNEAKAIDYLHRMQTVFGNDFFIEIMPHNPQSMNEQLVWMAMETMIPLVATPDCHHATPDQRVLNEIMLILNTHAKAEKKQSTVKDPIERLNDIYGADRQMSFNKFDIHMLSADELVAGMSYLPAHVLQEACEWSIAIANQIEPYTVESNLDLLPATEGKTDLDKLARQRLNKLGLISQEYVDRLDEELRIINEKNFAPYFMIVYNMITWARRHNIRVGPGRGSAAGSLLCYVLGITQIDPLKHDLLFSRFLNPERNDMPDIDVDIQDSRREEVKQYLRRKYGNVANITTWLTWADKGVVRDVARVFMVPLADVNKALKNIHTFEQFERDRDIEWFRQQYPDVLKYARLMRGRIRGSGVHAAGVVVCKDAISNYAPIETRLDNRTKQRQVTIGLDKDEAELVGLTKIDVLGLKSLSVLQDFCDITGIDFNTIPTDDPAVYKDIAAGYTKGVFQLDAPAYTKLCMQMKIANFNDLVASNALVRPGAMNTIGKEYVKRRLGTSTIQRIHPIYDRITETTYGLVIYQEQVMQLCVELGGMTTGEADKVRKIIGKKRDRSEFDVWKQKFVQGATQHVGVERAEWLWHSFEAHSDYSFNKSHAVAYSTLSYQTAWAKHYYPLEFIYASIKNERDQSERSALFMEARRLGIDVLYPHVDKSDKTMIIEDDSLRMGLTDIKYVADNIADTILKDAPYGSYKNWEFYSSKHTRHINKTVRKALDVVGALQFDDVDRPPVESEIYDYLGIPNFEFDVNMQFDRIDDYDEESAFIFKGVVRNIKRGKGWARAEIIDNTGICSLFVPESTTCEVGQAYIFVVAGNSLVSASPTSVAVEKYLRKEYDEHGQYIVATQARTTKTGKRIMNIVYAERDELRHAMVFDKNYVKGMSRLRPGNTVKEKIGRLQDGTRYFHFTG